MVLNRIEVSDLYKPIIKKKSYRVEPIEPIEKVHNNPNKIRSSDGDTFEESLSSLCFKNILKNELDKSD